MAPSKSEILVSQILLDFPDIVRDRLSPLGFNFAVRKKRSRPDSDAPEDPAAASPVTPLSFPPSEPDSKKICTEKSRKTCMDSIQELTRVRDCLTGEIAKVTKYYGELNAYNSELKAMKQKALQRKAASEIAAAQNRHRQIRWASHPLAVDPTAVRLQRSMGPVVAQFYSPYNGPGIGLGLGPGLVRIPDPSSRDRFAEARRLRRGIIKIKSMRRACGVKLPETSS